MELPNLISNEGCSELNGKLFYLYFFIVLVMRLCNLCDFFFFFSIYLLIISLNNYSYNTTEKKTTKQNTLTIDINRVKQD